MRTKKVNRYYCDYCKKAGCNKYWIVKHEKGCTMNPNRECGYCKMLELEQPKMSELLAILPNPEEYTTTFNDKWIHGETISQTKLDAVLDMKKLRDMTGNCPACILAALRQKGICVPMVTSFDFKKECASIWADINDYNSKDSYL